MLIMDLSLSAPSRTYEKTLIEAIVIAAFTFSKISFAIRHLFKAKRTNDILIMRLRALTLMDALFSILVLQNTLIMSVDGKIEGGMLSLSIASSSIISLVMILISIASFFGGRKAGNQN